MKLGPTPWRLVDLRGRFLGDLVHTGVPGPINWQPDPASPTRLYFHFRLATDPLTLMVTGNPDQVRAALATAPGWQPPTRLTMRGLE